ncbi:MAG: hypothetical protein ABIJ41_03830 [Candidatus Omnitrophota bacterium]
MPKYTKVIECALGLEVYMRLGAIRHAAYRYYLPKSDYVNMTLDRLDIDNPNSSSYSHFNYNLIATASAFNVLATRNTQDGGDGFSTIMIDQDGRRSGGGVYSGIR